MTGGYRFTRIERYVLFQVLKALGVSLAVIAGLVLLIDFVEVSRAVGRYADLGAARLFGLTLMKSPAVILQLLPFVFLFGTLAAFVGLNRRSELVAMRAAGVSAWRFVLPAGVAALMIGVITVTVLRPAGRVRWTGVTSVNAPESGSGREARSSPASGCGKATTAARSSFGPTVEIAPRAG